MKATIIFSIFVIVLAACNSANNKLITHPPSINQLAGSSRKTQKNAGTTIIKSDTEQNNAPRKLLGSWKVKGAENATFEIRKSSIFYPEYFKSYKYKMLGDSIKIHYDDFSESFGFKFRNQDTLILCGEEGADEYYRIKK